MTSAARATPFSTYVSPGRLLWLAALFIVLGFFVLYPLAMLLLGAFTRENPVIAGYSLSHLTLQTFWSVLKDPLFHDVTLRTLFVCAAGTLLAVLIGTVFSWIVVRTNTPFTRLISAVSVMPLLVPPLVAGIAWSILGSPRSGILNTLIGAMGFSWRINLYSLAGVIFVFGVYYAPYIYMFTSSALLNMDPSHEEAAEVSGSGPARILLTVTLPLILPAILSGMLLSFIVMIGTYGIPAALIATLNVNVLATYLFQLTIYSPPLYNEAAAVAVILAIVCILLVLLQQRLMKGRSFVTVSGKGFRPRKMRLGGFRWITLLLALLYCCIVVVLPIGALVVAAFRRFLFIPNAASLFDPKQYWLGHFDQVVNDTHTVSSVWNSLEAGIFTALIGGALAFAVSYTIYRTDSPGRKLLDIISSLPVAIPGLIVGLAYLWAWIGLPGGLYGSIWIIILAMVSRFMPDAVKSLSSSLIQVHKELEEAAWISGRTRLNAIGTVLLPLTLPGLISSMSLLFMLTIRELGAPLFLYSTNSSLMATVLFEYYGNGKFGATAAFGLIQIGIVGICALAGNGLALLVRRVVLTRASA